MLKGWGGLALALTVAPQGAKGTPEETPCRGGGGMDVEWGVALLTRPSPAASARPGRVQLTRHQKLFLQEKQLCSFSDTAGTPRPHSPGLRTERGWTGRRRQPGDDLGQPWEMPFVMSKLIISRNVGWP